MRLFTRWTKTALSILLIFIIGGLLIWQAGCINQAEQSFHEGEAETEKAVNGIGGLMNHYRGKVDIDMAQHRLSGLLEIDSKNNSGAELDAIYLHLYPNQFKENQALTGPNWNYVLGNDAERKPGWIDIHDVRVNHKQSNYDIENTILKIPLESGWEKGGEINVQIGFELVIPKNNGRFSYDEHAAWLGNWLPTVATYDQNGWNLDPYYPIGDPFYSDVANYDMEITLPDGFHLASTGIDARQEEVKKGDKKSIKVSARNVRDFAMVVMDKDYQVKEDQVNGITVRTWYLASDEQAVTDQLHQVGIESLKYFSDHYGEYPYQEYDIIRTGGFFGGMEYPGLVFIQGSYFTNNNPGGIVSVAHETAHQWWYGIVGNNEVKEPWIDESLTEYATLRFLLDKYPRVGSYILKSKETRLSRSDVYEEKGEYLGNSVDRFSDWDTYVLLIYNKGPMMFYELEQEIGLEKMNQILSDYFAKYQFKNAKTGDLIDVFADHLGSDIKEYFSSWLTGGEAQFSQ